MAKSYDVAVLGATPAGLTAAIALAGKKRRVVVVDSPAGPTESPLADWVPCDLFERAPFLRGLPRAAGGQAFARVHFHNAETREPVEYRHGRPAGYFFAANRLVAALKAAARKAKVSLADSAAWPALDLREDSVHLGEPCSIEARLLMIAQDCPAAVISALALPVRNVPRSTLAVTALELGWTAVKIRKHFPPCLHIVSLSRRSDLGLFFPTKDSLHVRLITQAVSPTARPDSLGDLLGMLRGTGALPADTPTDKVRGAVWYPPAGIALDLETHVAKRTLLIGTAGGFAGLMTGQTIAPSIRSALVAATAAERALTSEDQQGALGAFKNEWRRALADYLRPPNTSLQLLLPLVFINQRMVARFARAMLFGESI